MKKHQIKSCWYYLFWGIATVSVVVGQVYVGNSYRKMTNSNKKAIEKVGKTGN